MDQDEIPPCAGCGMDWEPDMQSQLEQIRERLQALLPLLTQQYGVESLSLFGSHVRHEARVDSDLDLLVTFHTLPGLLKFVELENFLADELGLPVDLVMRDALRQEITPLVLREAVPV
jgi:uncharacterized protein